MKKTNRLVWIAVLALALLVTGLIWLRSRPVARSAAASPVQETVSTNLALVLWVRPAGSVNEAEWTKVAETPGTITVPAGHVLKAEVRARNTFRDPEAVQLAEDFAGLTSLHTLDLTGTGITDTGLEQLAGLTSLRYLNLWGTLITDAGLVHVSGLTTLQLLLLPSGITDAGLAYLAGLTGLQGLYLPPSITDAGLAHLAGLTGLRSLELTRAKITDAGVAHLAKLTSLRELDLGLTAITDAGVAALKQALPDAEIRWHVEIIRSGG